MHSTLIISHYSDDYSLSCLFSQTINHLPSLGFSFLYILLPRVFGKLEIRDKDEQVGFMSCVILVWHLLNFNINMNRVI